MHEGENRPNIIEIRQANAIAIQELLQPLFTELEGKTGDWFSKENKINKKVTKEIILKNSNDMPFSARVELSYGTVSTDFQIYSLYIKIFDPSKPADPAFASMNAVIELHGTELGAVIGTKVTESYQGLGIPTALLVFGEAPMIEFLKKIALKSTNAIETLRIVFEDNSSDGWTTRKADFLEQYDYDEQTNQFVKTIPI